MGGTGGTAFTDPSYAALALTGNVKWFVTTSGFDCDPSVRPAAGKVGTTKSNSSNERQFPATNGLNSFSNIERNISIYPNPAQNRIFVESSDISGHAEIQLTDLTGRIIQRKSLVNPRTEIETEEYSNGVYFVQITQNGNITCTSKIIIQH